MNLIPAYLSAWYAYNYVKSGKKYTEHRADAILDFDTIADGDHFLIDARGSYGSLNVKAKIVIVENVMPSSGDQKVYAKIRGRTYYCPPQGIAVFDMEGADFCELFLNVAMATAYPVRVLLSDMLSPTNNNAEFAYILS